MNKRKTVYKNILIELNIDKYKILNYFIEYSKIFILKDEYFYIPLYYYNLF